MSRRHFKMLAASFDTRLFAITGSITKMSLAKPLPHYHAQKKVRCRNRQLHMAGILPGGIWKKNQAPKEVKGFRLLDFVRYEGQTCEILGRRTSGFLISLIWTGTKSAHQRPAKIFDFYTFIILTERKSQGRTEL